MAGYLCQFQTGLPFSSRSTRVSVPFTTSRARMRSASPCLTFEPVSPISSPLLKFTPMSSRKALGQRYTSAVSVPVFTSRWATSFSLPFGGSFTSSTVPFILISVCRSYFGGFDFAFFCAITATHRNARINQEKSVLQRPFSLDSLGSRILPLQGGRHIDFSGSDLFGLCRGRSETTQKYKYYSPRRWTRLLLC